MNEPNFDYRKLGLKVGLENCAPCTSAIEQIHQQLDTERKLFCSCSPVLCKKEPDFTLVRRLRPTQSELGEIDQAALFEYERGKKIYYEGYLDTTCLVEADGGAKPRPTRRASS